MTISRILFIYGVSSLLGGAATFGLILSLRLLRKWLVSRWPLTFGNISETRGNERKGGKWGVKDANDFQHIEQRPHANGIVHRVAKINTPNTTKSVSNSEGNSKTKRGDRYSKPSSPIYSIHKIYNLTLIVIGIGTGILFAGVLSLWNHIPLLANIILLACFILSLDICSGLTLNNHCKTQNKHKSTNNPGSQVVPTESTKGKQYDSHNSYDYPDKFNHWPSLMVHIITYIKSKWND